MELRVDCADAMGAEDCFLSVRVGNIQKLTKLTASHSYSFPSSSDRRYGKIEVFRRIGTCALNIDSTVSNKKEVTMACEDVLGNLRFNIAIDSQREDESSHPKKIHPKVAAAKEYLDKHGLENQLSEIMREVLKEQPENPHEIFAAKLLSGPAAPMKLPPLKSAPKLADPGLIPTPTAPLGPKPEGMRPAPGRKLAPLEHNGKNPPPAPVAEPPGEPAGRPLPGPGQKGAPALPTGAANNSDALQESSRKKADACLTNVGSGRKEAAPDEVQEEDLRGPPALISGRGTPETIICSIWNDCSEDVVCAALANALAST